MAPFIERNASSIPNGDLRGIAETAGWEDSAALLFLVGPTVLDPEYQALTVYHGDRDFLRFRQLDQVTERWDCAILIGASGASMHAENRPLFTWLLGHEMGHARVALSDPEAHRLFVLVQEHIKTASAGAVSRWDQLPYESRFDQFGKWVAETLHGEEAFLAALDAQITQGGPPDPERLQRVRARKARSDLDRIFMETKVFVAPYSRALKAGIVASAATERSGYSRARADDVDLSRLLDA